MTLDRAEVSLERAFEPGMAYVALRWVAAGLAGRGGQKLTGGRCCCAGSK